MYLVKNIPSEQYFRYDAIVANRAPAFPFALIRFRQKKCRYKINNTIEIWFAMKSEIISELDVMDFNGVLNFDSIQLTNHLASFR